MIDAGASAGTAPTKAPLPMRIAITGASGLVGRATTAALEAAGHAVVRLVRSGAGRARTAQWDPETGAVDLTALGPIDAVVHLAGENVAGGRWSTARKRRIADSRGPATRALCRTLADAPQRPHTFVSASAVGIYGSPGDTWVDEQSPLGDDFLARVAKDWEAGAKPLAEVGTRVVHLRIGVVLDKEGGALQRMLLPFRLGLGGPLGSGDQWLGWITRHDLVRVILTALTDARYRGPVVATSPMPVQSREFAQALGKALHRPAVLRTPTFALRLLFGEMADALLLRSFRPRPGVLLENGFLFDHPRLDVALAAALGVASTAR
jgi:uncharacterized protein (TIGR01777 family)